MALLQVKNGMSNKKPAIDKNGKSMRDGWYFMIDEGDHNPSFCGPYANREDAEQDSSLF